MKKSFLYVAMMLVLFQIQAQNENPPQTHRHQGEHMRIHANEDNCRNVAVLKRQYMADSLKLTAEEAKDFWIAYDKIEQIEGTIHENFLNFKKENNLTNENGRVAYNELTNDQKLLFLEKRIQMKTDLAHTEQAFFDEIKQILKPETVLQYYQLEKNFRKEMVKQSQLLKREKELKKEAIPNKQRR